MNLITHKPGIELHQIIQKMWMIEETPDEKVSVKAFPTGYAFINIIQGEEFCLSAKGKPILKTRCYIAGQSYSPFNLKMASAKRAITIQLQPYALPALFGIPANEFLDHQLDLHQVRPELAERLEDLINQDKPGKKVLESVEDTFNQYVKNTSLDPRVLYGLNLILREKGALGMPGLYDALNVSQRRGQQLFKHYLGMSAKSFCQVIKMQFHTFELLTGKQAELRVPDDYYDQSHYIHEVKKQTGMLPTEYQQYINDPRKKAAYLSSNLYFQPGLLP